MTEDTKKIGPNDPPTPEEPIKWSTFAGYLETELVEGNEFRLKVVRNPDGKLDFYIHPDGRDGMTGDFEVVGNVALPLNVAAGSAR